MGQIVQAEGLKVDRERVQSRLSELAASYPNPDEVRRAYLHSQDAMRQIESAVLEDQVVDWVLERAHVTERPESFKELTDRKSTRPNSSHRQKSYSVFCLEKKNCILIF